MITNMSTNDIGKKIYERRKQLRLTLEDVGKAVGVSKTTVQRWESGLIKNMGRDKIAALANVLHMDPVEFVPGPSSAPKVTRIKLKRTNNSFVRAIVNSSIREPVEGIKFTDVSAIPTFEDPKYDSLMKEWRVATPENKDTIIQVLKAMNVSAKKGGSL